MKENKNHSKISGSVGILPTFGGRDARAPRFLSSFGVLACLLSFGLPTAGAWLSCPAESSHRADGVVVLGGGGGARCAARGRDLMRQGQSSCLLVINPSDAERQDAQKALRALRGGKKTCRSNSLTWSCFANLSFPRSCVGMCFLLDCGVPLLMDAGESGSTFPRGSVGTI